MHQVVVTHFHHLTHRAVVIQLHHLCYPQVVVTLYPRRMQHRRVQPYPHHIHYQVATRYRRPTQQHQVIVIHPHCWQPVQVIR